MTRMDILQVQACGRTGTLCWNRHAVMVPGSQRAPCHSSPGFESVIVSSEGCLLVYAACNGSETGVWLCLPSPGQPRSMVLHPQPCSACSHTTSTLGLSFCCTLSHLFKPTDHQARNALHYPDTCSVHNLRNVFAQLFDSPGSGMTARQDSTLPQSARSNTSQTLPHQSSHPCTRTPSHLKSANAPPPNLERSRLGNSLF